MFAPGAYNSGVTSNDLFRLTDMQAGQRTIKCAVSLYLSGLHQLNVWSPLALGHYSSKRNLNSSSAAFTIPHNPSASCTHLQTTRQFSRHQMSLATGWPFTGECITLFQNITKEVQYHH